MQLLPRELAERHGYVSRLRDARTSPAHLCLFLGYDEPLELPRHIVWQMPHYEDVARFDLSAADRVYKREVRIEGMACYLMSPSARDPPSPRRHPDRTTVIVLAEAAPDWLARAQAEAGFRAELEERLIRELLGNARRHFPALAGKTPRLVHLALPIGCNAYARDGCSYGLAATPERLVRDAHWLRPQTTVPGLYLAGQDAFMPGIAGVLIGARFCYAAITGDWRHVVSREGAG